MSPKRPSDSDSDSDGPEAVSLSSSKKVSEAHTKAIREHERNQRAKRKNDNRARDTLLKEEKAKRVNMVKADVRVKNTKGKAKNRKMTTAERMERAMEEAAGEDDGEDSEEGDKDVDKDEMEEDDSEEEEWAGLNIVDVSDAKPLQLPDCIFAAAAATVNSDSSKAPSRSNKTTKLNKKKRKTNKAKDLIIGNRAIKTLSSSDRDVSITGRFQPPPEANKFVAKQLQLHSRNVTVETTPSLAKRSGPVGRQKPSKDDSKAKDKNVKYSQSKGWNRVPVNLGSMRSGGPAKNFVRGATNSLASRA